MDIKRIRKSVLSKTLPNPKRDRARFNMTLGSLVKALKRERTKLHVIIDDDETIGAIYGYVKYPGDLAFATTTVPISVEELIAYCTTIMNRTIKGPEGHMYINSNAPLWVQDKPLIDVIADAGVIKIILGNKEDK